MTFRREKKNKKLLYQHGRCRNKNEVILTEIPGEATPRSKKRSVRRDAASIGWQVRRPVCSSVRERWRIVRPLQYVPTWGVRGLRTVLSRRMGDNRECGRSGERTRDLLLR